ncbi:hypothetical protein F5Y15DRAFT_414788 [Xylariaceae sp. FL0016]|nr:hypothetical protein F5Y15DRAFT_414788 [Xylariaceae sp. FL0016]
MPSFGRLGKHSNRSQHNLVEQQQQQQQQQQPQQLQLQHQQQLQQQQQQQQREQHLRQQSQTQKLGSGGAAPPPSQAPSSTTASPSHAQPSGRRVSGAGVHPDAANNAPPASSGPSPGLTSSDSLQQPQPAVQPAQQTSHNSPQQLQHQRQPQRSLNHAAAAQPSDLYANNNPNISPSLNPTVHAQNQNSLPLSQPNPAAAYTARQQPHENFADLVSRSQSARFSQQIPPLQTQQHHQFTIASSSADDLPQTAHLASPVVSQASTPGQGLPPSSLSHSQTAPTEKRSTRKLIKNILSGSSSSSRPTSDHYQDSYDNTASLVVRRPSKRSANSHSARGTSLLTRSVDHPDWVPPPSTSSRHHPLPPHNQHSPASQGVGAFEDPYIVTPSNQEILLQNSQETLPNTIRHVPPEVNPSPYDPEDLAFHQRQAIAHHQAQIIQAQQHGHGQAQAQIQAHPEQQQQIYGQIVVDPAQNQYQYSHPHEQYQASPQVQQAGSRPSLYAGHLSTESPQPPNPETISQLSYESPTSESEQQQQQQQAANSQATQESPAVKSPQPESQTPPNPQPVSVSPQPSAAQGQGQTQAQTMAPPTVGPGQSRRSGENDKVGPPSGPPPGFRHSQGPMSSMNPLPPTPGVSTAPQNFRASGVQGSQQYDGAGDDRGRNSPQPSTGERDGADPDKQFKDLLTKYKNVKRLYFDGKTQIEQLNAQVEQLQNAVANQRMSQSRTALDDSEYSTRFNRLNGAVNNLSFNIRKDWRSLPGWIERYVSPDALKTGKQEMTAVGRAIIVRWLYDEIFNKCFHPGLDVDLSCHLKQIEQNIRRNSYTLNSQEEYEALTAKVVNWRMATLEGLQNMLHASESNDYKADFTKMATSNLTATLLQYLSDPPPAGVDGSASMIIELAVGIAANLPMESRDVALIYPLPGEAIQSDIMELEKSGLPPLPEPSDEPEDSAKDDKATKREKTKSGMLTMLGGAPHPASRKGSTASILTDTATPPAASPAKDPARVRFAGFLGVEVRGRQVLVKAPVWSLA